MKKKDFQTLLKRNLQPDTANRPVDRHLLNQAFVSYLRLLSYLERVNVQVPSAYINPDIDRICDKLGFDRRDVTG